MWADLVLVAKLCGGVVALWLLMDAVVWLRKHRRQQQMDAIVAENARVSRRDERLREWRLRDLDDLTDRPATERRMHLVMKSSTRRVH